MSSRRILNLRARASLDQVILALGGTEAIEPDQRVVLSEAIGQVAHVSQPKGNLAFIDIEQVEKKTVITADGQRLQGLGVSGLLTNCQQIAAFVVSLGPGAEELVARATRENRLVHALFLDAVASEMVEDLAEQAQTEVAALANGSQRAITYRYSPGYCDWPLQQQRVLERWLNFPDIGVDLTDTLMMVPEKTITAIVGIGSAGSSGTKLARPPACRQCQKKFDCPGPRASEVEC